MDIEKINKGREVLQKQLCSEGRKGLQLLLDGLGVKLPADEEPTLKVDDICKFDTLEIYEDCDSDFVAFFRVPTNREQLYVAPMDFDVLFSSFRLAKGDIAAMISNNVLEYVYEVEDVLENDDVAWDYFTQEYINHLKYVCNMDY